MSLFSDLSAVMEAQTLQIQGLNFRISPIVLIERKQYNIAEPPDPPVEVTIATGRVKAEFRPGLQTDWIEPVISAPVDERMLQKGNYVLYIFLPDGRAVHFGILPGVSLPFNYEASEGVTTEWVEDYVQAAIDPLPTVLEVNAAISNALIPYATQTYVNSQVAAALVGYATQTYVGTAISSALVGYATQAYVTTQLANYLTLATNKSARVRDWRYTVQLFAIAGQDNAVSSNWVNRLVSFVVGARFPPPINTAPTMLDGSPRHRIMANASSESLMATNDEFYARNSSNYKIYFAVADNTYTINGLNTFDAAISWGECWRFRRTGVKTYTLVNMNDYDINPY